MTLLCCIRRACHVAIQSTNWRECAKTHVVELNKLGRGQATKAASNQTDADPRYAPQVTTRIQSSPLVSREATGCTQAGRAGIHYRNKPESPLAPFPTCSIQPHAFFTQSLPLVGFPRFTHAMRMRRQKNQTAYPGGGTGPRYGLATIKGCDSSSRR